MSGALLRTCATCDLEKPERSFPFNGGTSNRRKTCRACYKRRWRANQGGHLVKPDSCEGCHRVITEPSDLHAHHEDYEYPLDIQWLCVRCHTQLHQGAV